MECELERYLIIISCGLMDIEKRRDGLQVIYRMNLDGLSIPTPFLAGS
jgi:hypothetical protein